MRKAHGNALPAGYQFEGYRIEAILGAGGFGITYRAREVRLDRDVAIKEFLPRELAMRGDNGASVEPISADDQSTFEYGLSRFEDEARTLTKFRHPNIVPVHRAFEANNTAYLVMEYVEGASLYEILHGRMTLDEAQLRAVFAPLLDGLETVHETGYLHRDIKPGNIYLRADGTPVLIDFGAARAAMTERSKTLTSVVTAGYAPFEQYFVKGKQGPWTDIYAMAATMYRAVTGMKPPEAPERQEGDPYRAAATAVQSTYSAPLLAAIDKGLAVKPGERPQSVAAWRRMLGFAGEAVSADPSLAAAVVAKVTSAETSTRNPDGATSPRKQATAVTTLGAGGRPTAFAATLSILLFAAGGVYLAARDGNLVDAGKSAGSTTVTQTPGTTGDGGGASTGGGRGGDGGATLPGQEATRPPGGRTTPGTRPGLLPGTVPGADADCPGSLTALQGRYHETDCSYVARVFAEAIGAARAPGATWRWSNRASGNRGTMTVLAFFQSADGRYCRRIRQTLVSDGETLTDAGVGCREGTRWRITQAK
ncbi:MAG TPA: serine/threonine-protein kinase [Alphaproteobacteria bacterium]|nr:serine/threonine-protein kinase [Alphaproteobacteria bacterium]